MNEKEFEYLQGIKQWLEDTKDVSLEEMDKFFAVRVGGYEEHMASWEGHYQWMAELVPEGSNKLLDLGCGTGLELDHIFKRFPQIEVTGIDLAEAMLAELERKHAGKKLSLRLEDYFTADFGKQYFDVAISFETLHHFKPEKKLQLFKKLYEALKEGGCYIECDYIARSKEQEELLFAECERRRLRDGIAEEVFVHFDTPLTLDHEVSLMKQAGFQSVEVMWKDDENTPMIIAMK